ncbi:hypothetical protein [Nonomuraea sp. SBT364]|uniref:hypothetical protein n=1 Tax=Nonomuraea sp. SBT364 TaxID=1580530 RepID=UPI00066D9C0F|nr:hypothetical protein [Nonomuraea sp. SBT364]
MNADLEKSLAEELARAAGHAPRPAHDLRARIEAGHRRRRRTGTALSAAAVAVLSAAVTVVITVAVTVAASPPVPVATRPSPTFEPSAPATADPALPPVEKVWPGALHTVPRNLPNGQELHPERFLDDRSLLVRTLDVDRIDALWAYDVRKRTARRLVDVRSPRGTVVTAPFVAVGDGLLAWWTLRRERNARVVEIWTAPVTGGSQRKVATLKDAPQGIDLTIAGGRLVWSPWGREGVYRMPLTGGAAKPVAGSAGHTLLAWPWAARPRPGVRKGGNVTFGDLVDLRTGAREQAPVTIGACSLTWCVSGRTAMRRDGGGRRELPGDATAGDVPALDRFALLSRRGADSVLYDLAGAKGGMLRSTGYTPVLDYRMPGLLTYMRGGEQVVVNLKAIR